MLKGINLHRDLSLIIQVRRARFSPEDQTICDRILGDFDGEAFSDAAVSELKAVLSRAFVPPWVKCLAFATQWIWLIYPFCLLGIILLPSNVVAKPIYILVFSLAIAALTQLMLTTVLKSKIGPPHQEGESRSAD